MMHSNETKTRQWFAPVLVIALGTIAAAQQPPVTAGPNEPDWRDLLKTQWQLDLDRDLRNPLSEGVAPAALFRRVDPNKPVVFTPLIALGMETTTHGGWYVAGPRAGDVPSDLAKARHELWSYDHKQPAAEQETGKFTPPPLTTGATEFDPGNQVFGLWVKNDHFHDAGVFTQLSLVARVNERLRSQPYKAMIYPARDPENGRFIPDSYLIGWEYSTNDDFQDVVTRIDNVRLLPSDPPLMGILPRRYKVTQLADGFEFVEGPAWDFKTNALYFSDIPPAHIVRYDGRAATVAKRQSGNANGLMFDRERGISSPAKAPMKGAAGASRGPCPDNRRPPSWTAIAARSSTAPMISGSTRSAASTSRIPVTGGETTWSRMSKRSTM
jgi:hypothetical protein